MHRLFSRNLGAFTDTETVTTRVVYTTILAVRKNISSPNSPCIIDHSLLSIGVLVTDLSVHCAYPIHKVLPNLAPLPVFTADDFAKRSLSQSSKNLI